MQQLSERAKPKGAVEGLGTLIIRVLISLFVPIVTFLVLYVGFRFLRDANAPKGIVALVAIVWGVGGVGLLYLVANWFAERLGDPWRARIQPFVFIGPAVAILLWYLALPTARTFWLSLLDRNGQSFVGLSNYVAAFTNRDMFTAFRNNLLWIVFGATFVSKSIAHLQNLFSSLNNLTITIVILGIIVFPNFFKKTRNTLELFGILSHFAIGHISRGIFYSLRILYNNYLKLFGWIKFC